MSIVQKGVRWKKKGREEDSPLDDTVFALPSTLGMLWATFFCNKQQTHTPTEKKQEFLRAHLGYVYFVSALANEFLLFLLRNPLSRVHSF